MEASKAEEDGVEQDTPPIKLGPSPSLYLWLTNTTKIQPSPRVILNLTLVSTVLFVEIWWADCVG